MNTPLSSHITPALLERLAGRVLLAEGEHASIDVVAPFTGALLGQIPRGTPADVREAVRRARAAQPAWAETSFEERRAIFLRFHDLLLERQVELLDLVQLEAGKARHDAFEELADTAIVARYYAVRAERILRPRRRRGALPLLTSTYVHHHPVGVVGFIVPWNYPLNVAITDAAAAVLAGNTAILKPDHQTSLTALFAAELLYEAGLPRDVLSLVTGEGPELGPAILDAVDYIMFTGSTRTGRIIATQAAERLIGCSLELGGKNPLLVLEDADLERAMEGAVRACFVGAGQVCVSVERIYVHQALYERFAARLVERVRRLRLGGALDYSVDVGSLTSARQLGRVEEHVADAVAKGATVLTGGRARPDLGPFFYEPTILSGVEPGMKCYDEETFGPVVALYRVASEEEAVARANETRYGLSASVWTRDEWRGREVAARIRAGTVNVNEGYAATWASVDAPIGGMKDSGLGRRHGAEGILKYTEPQTIAVQRLLPVAAPAGAGKERYARWMSRALALLRRTPGMR
jgi:acyl-CoA reductase-like NAD-dependent aldehyde dehydrogenase